jgi:hypothetical protein
MRRTLLIPVILILSTLLLAGGVYLVLKEFQKNSATGSPDPFLWIPANAEIIIHMKRPPLVAESLLQTGPLKDETDGLLKLYGFTGLVQYLDSVIRLNAEVSEIWENAQAVLSFLESTQGQADFVAQITLPKIKDKEKVKQLLKDELLKGIPISEGYYGNEDFYTLNQAGENRKVHFVIRKDAIIITSKATLAGPPAPENQMNRSILSDSHFNNIRNLSGRFTDNIYIKTDALCRRVPGNYIEKIPFSFSCDRFAGWQTWDISYQPGGVALTGFARTETYGEYFTDNLKRHQSITSEIHNYIPLVSSMIIYFGLSDIRDFSATYSDWMNIDYQGEWFHLQERRFTDVTGMAPSELPAIWNGEAAWIVPQRNNETGEGVLLLGIQNIDSLLMLNGLSTFFKPDPDTLSGRIFQNTIPGLASLITHGLVEANPEWLGVSGNGDYLAMASSAGALKTYFRSVASGLHFGLSDAAMNMHEFMYKGQSFLFHLQGTHQTSDETNEISGFPENLSFSLQVLPASGGNVFSNAMVFFRQGTENDAPRQWETDLGATIHTGPFMVTNHNSGRREFILQDSKNRLRLIDKDGNLLWSKSLNGPIFSEIYQVDIFQNGRYQFLFNTRNYLHLIDRNGNYVSGYPMRLPSPASAGIAVFDYDSNKNYRIIFPAENRRIYNYNLRRQQVEGWQYKQSARAVRQPVQYIRSGDRDFLFVTDVSGNVQIINRQGNTAIKLPQEFVTVAGTQVFASKTADGKPFFTLAGQKGKIFRVFEDGTTETFEIAGIREDSRILQTNLKNHSPNIIFLKNSVLSAFDAAATPVFSTRLQISTDADLNTLTTAAFGQVISIIDKKNEKIYMINASGEIIYPFPLDGDSRMLITEDQPGEVYLITGFRNQLRKYSISSTANYSAESTPTY